MAQGQDIMTTSHRRRAHLVAMLLAGALGGCTVGPDYRPPETRISESWLAPVGAGEVAAAWGQAFGDTLLTELVDRKSVETGRKWHSRVDILGQRSKKTQTNNTR